MKLLAVNKTEKPQFKAFQLKKNESRLVNSLLKEYINYASPKVRDEIFCIYDPYLTREAEIIKEEGVIKNDYLQRLRLLLLKNIELYKALPKVFLPEKFLTTKMNSIKPSSEDKMLFDDIIEFSTDALPQKEFNMIKDTAEKEQPDNFEDEAEGEIFYPEFQTGIPILDRMYEHNAKFTKKTIDRLDSLLKSKRS